MPQMSPLWWEVLFMMFIFTFMLFNIMIYFTNKNMMINKMTYYKKIKNLTWMW
uniref:ATP synthase F0 subunit 8 n=1 Tax=Eocanthecona thomsoni TaxID=2575655 RepID=A0A4D6X5G1_9HEMI|nr:ATP synthase F0 subunit 8 [Eocanthecona thomsoni]QCI09868.1 ATP synthase F0 subunit 8 [Eocanthecona thomsoni]